MTTFKPELIDQIVQGNKTQTRRPVKAGEVPVVMPGDYEIAQTGNIIIITLDNLTIAGVRQNGRLKYCVGRDYAIQPGRGKSCAWWKPSLREWIPAGDVRGDFHHAAGYRPLRYRLTKIRREDVRDISHADAVAEGFSIGRAGFWRVWCEFYDPQALILLEGVRYDREYKADLMTRPDELYQAWVLSFEVVGRDG